MKRDRDRADEITTQIATRGASLRPPEFAEGPDPYAAFSRGDQYSPCVQLSAAMQLALNGESKARVQLMEGRAIEGGEKARWSTGIVGLDSHTDGGFHGFSGLVGDEGTGKSDLALHAGLLAAHPSAGWEVYYINGELDRFDLRARFDRLASVFGDGALEAASEHFCIYHLSRGKTLSHIVDFLQADVLMREASRAVVIFDTVDTIASWAPDYLNELREIYLWSMGARMLVPDLLSVLCVAEPNKSGQGKGRRLEKWADFVISMRAKHDKGPHRVSFKVTKGRYSGRADLLEWDHDWKTCSFRLASF